jgi:hypothetical protein
MDYSKVKLIPPDQLDLPIHGDPHPPANHDLIQKLNRVSTATASAELHRMGKAR